MQRSGISVMSKLVGLVKPMIGYMILAIILGSVGHLMATAIPVLGAYGLLRANSLTPIIICLTICGISRGILRYGEQICNHYIAFKLLADIRYKVFDKLRSLAPAKLETKEKGNIIALLTSDIELLEVFYAHTISPTIIALLFSVVMTMAIGRTHWLLGVMVGITYLTIGAVVPILFKGSGGQIGYQYREKLGMMNSFFLDSIRGLPEIQQFGQQDRRLNRLGEYNQAVEAINEKLKVQEGKNRVVTDRVIFGTIVIYTVLAGGLFFRQAITIKEVIITFVAFASSFGPTVALSNLSNNLFHTIASGNRVLDLMAEEPLIDEIKGKERQTFGEVKCREVSFSYDTELVIDKASLKIKRGEILGIHGKSGCGKSTLLKLLMRFFKLNDGCIDINQINLEEINTSDLRDMESYVTQETCLFNTSIKENIKIAKADATDEEVVLAAQKASLHEFIKGLPQGYDTNVGELGEQLSGGEKQRIGIARAFLHNAPLMLLDEPTSNLDSLNEGIILKAIKEMGQDKTIVLVSHRESTMGIADNIMTLE